MRHILIFLTLSLLAYTSVLAQTVPTVWANTRVPVYSANKDSMGYATLSQLFSGYGSGLSWNVGGNTVSAHSVFGTNAAYDLIFRTNSTERMRILSNGNVGIGTTTPTYALDISVNGVGVRLANTTISSPILVLNGANGYLHTTTSESSTGGVAGARFKSAITSSQGEWLWTTSAGDRMILNASGNLGVGTTTPNHTLSLSTGATTAIGLYNTIVQSSNRNWGIGTNLGIYGDFSINTSTAEGGNPITAGATRLYINPSGNIGIGTNSPASILHLLGTDPRLTVSSNATGSAASPSGASLDLNAFNNSYKVATISGISQASNYAWGELRVNVASNILSGTIEERMRIMGNTGNVGIATTAPTAKLDVNGDLRVRSVGSAASSDSVATLDAIGNLRRQTRTDFLSDVFQPNSYVSNQVFGRAYNPLKTQYVNNMFLGAEKRYLVSREFNGAVTPYTAGSIFNSDHDDYGACQIPAGDSVQFTVKINSKNLTSMNYPHGRFYLQFYYELPNGDLPLTIDIQSRQGGVWRSATVEQVPNLATNGAIAIYYMPQFAITVDSIKIKLVAKPANGFWLTEVDFVPERFGFESHTMLKYGMQNNMYGDIGGRYSTDGNISYVLSANTSSYFNQNLGVGTTNPTSKLHVVGTTNLVGATTITGTATATGLQVNGNGNITGTFQLTTGATNNYVLQSDASGNASWVAPSSVLSNASGFIQNGNSFGATAAIGTNDNYDFRFKTNGSTKATLNQSGYFGIGVIAPDYKLDIWAASEGNPIRARGIQQSTSSADSALYVTSGGVFVRKEAPLRTAGALPTTAADEIGYQVLYVTATDTSQLTYIGGNKWRADFVKSATTPSVMVTSGSQLFDYTTATWRNTAVSVVSGEIVDFSYQNGSWKSIAPMDIRTFGGKDGTDISAALAQAMLYTKKIYIPKGNYLAANVQLKSGIEIYGDGDSTVIQSLDTTTTKILYANSSDTNIVNNVKDITLHNIKFLGRVAAAGFSEFKHLVNLNGVTGVVIDNVTFEGFRGDGLYIGTGIIGGEHRHNRNITVRNCRFDGVNKDNRNAISVIDCDGIKIEKSVFKNCTRPEMPSPIDFEVDEPYSSYKNIEIVGNHFENNGGFQLIGIYQKLGMIDTLRNVSIRDNSALNNTCHYEIHINSYLNITSATSTPMNIVIDNWTGKGGKRPFYIRNANGVSVLNSSFEDYAYDAVIGIETSNTYNVTLKNNSFTRCGNTATVTGVEPFTEFYVNFGALTIYTAKDVLIDKMDFIECGNGSTYRCGIYIVAGTTSYLNFSNLNLKGTYNYSVFRNSNNTNDAKSFRLKNVTDGYLHNVANYLSDDKGGTINTFDDTNVLNDFPVGKSSTIINGVTIGGYTQGVLITEKYTNFSSYTNWGVQYFIPRSISGGNDTTDIFIRKSSNDASSWYAWAKIGEKNTATNRVKVTTSYTVLTSDRYISVENETANVTLTLPKARDFPKRLLTIKRVQKAGGAVSSGTITLTPTSSPTSQAGNIENLDGTFGASTTLTAQGVYGSTITLISNGAEWERINN